MSDERRRRGVRVPTRIIASRPFRRYAPKVVPRAHRAIHKLSRGRLLDSRANPMCMLTTIGSRSGQPRQTPLAAVPIEDGKLLLVGSNFASDKHPAWTGNLLAHPEATVTFRGSTYTASTRLLNPEEREQRWDVLVAWYPNWSEYVTISDREFRIFEVTPT